jgi:hypothetical protein
MKTAVSQALKQQHGITVTSWYHRADDEAKAYPRIEDREKAHTIRNIKIGNKTLPIANPKIIIPSHPFELIVIAERLPTKESLDRYCKQFGLYSS